VPDTRARAHGSGRRDKQNNVAALVVRAAGVLIMSGLTQNPATPLPVPTPQRRASLLWCIFVFFGD
jgi:hypothetical protein